MTFYARNSTAEFYHLVSDDRNVTLCGVPVALVVIDRTAETATLHLTSKLPPDRTLCRRCAIIKSENENHETAADASSGNIISTQDEESPNGGTPGD